MKYHGKIFLAVMIIVMGLSMVVWAETSPGTEDDPLVTLSLVNAKISEVKSYVDQKISSINSNGGSQSEYTPLYVEKGKKLIGSEGTEVILRSGEATAIDNGQNGVSDLTGAADLRTGDPVILNHLILIPRSDGRGISAETEIWVMIKGGYTIE